MGRKTNPPKWGKDVTTVLHPGFGAPVSEEVQTQGVQRYLRQAVEHGWVVMWDEPTSVTLGRSVAYSAVRGAGVGFLFAGPLGAGLGAALGGGSQQTRVRIWADGNGAVYAREV